MPNQLLLSNKFKKIGWTILIPSAIAGIALLITDYQVSWLNLNVLTISHQKILGERQFFCVVKSNVTNTLVGVVFIIGSLLVSFSKEKNEDEYIALLRLKSLQWSLLLNYTLLLFAFIFIHGWDFLYVMLYNIFTIISIFILHFNYILLREKSKTSEK